MTDLRSRLHDVVDGPGDPPAVLADRGATALDDVLVGALTARVRRRRAVRTGATGALGALTVVAVAVGATALTNGRGAARHPAADADDAALHCGDVVLTDTIRPRGEGLTLAAPALANSTVVAGEPVDVTAALTYEGTVRLEWDVEQYLQLAVLQDGTVVATGMLPFIEAMSPGRYTTEDTVPLWPCAAVGELAPGAYDLVATVALAKPDDANPGADALELSAGPAPFRIVAAPASAEEAVRQAEVALAEVVAAADAARADAAIGTCGTRMPEVTDPYLGLDVELGASAQAGEPVYGTGSLTSRDGLTVVGDAPMSAVRLVLTRDGVVVGRGQYDADYASRLVVDGHEPLELPAVGDAVICRLPGAEGPTLPLPPGTYQAYGLLEVTVSEVQAPGDVFPTPVTGTRTVVTEPVDVVVGDG
ncbi:hypothetical protein [Actinotalea fermentans]|uniref:Uncharacterized protein n=1 Tax=Actinotalea fermentans TaxID=43671 RepID=A0A511YY01_9CELL|nr:hypothetical protein [Actinotalea fermentans]KGM15989.1 hypothetical protein N867_04050 [Actinotalea fermentans ATCC 43279 = JCM 9966 = DSM 3133]GEN80085.1 hypothetical protein AFE02nite_18190 [Actinotalea fermentans]